MEKTCSRCGESKFLTDFGKNKSRADGLQGWCKSCTAVYRKQYFLDNYKAYKDRQKIQNALYDKRHKDKEQIRNKETSRQQHLRRVFGITEEQYKELLMRQNSCCAICKKPKEYFSRNLSVDHNHKTGEIRGLLCYPCNMALGMFHDNEESITQAAEYVKKRTGWFVPEKYLRGPKRRRKRK